MAGAFGVDALRHVSRRQQLVLASLPLLLGAHMLDESVVWWGLHGQVSATAMRTAIYVFLAFAFLLPFLVPLALFGVETVPGRRRWMAALLALGAVTSALLLVEIVRSPAGASIDGSHIAYVSGGSDALLLGVFYVLATCGALLVASSRMLAAFGIVNLAAVIVLGWLTFTGLTSLWCAWAALSSVVVVLYLRRRALPAVS
ncbi:MAG TPA: DUF6629 family protein [Candidatus Dormibacteraeota bacterium]|nr:DUF6629 family protein [Candidatus Dormibacteraeota bacterium]